MRMAWGTSAGMLRHGQTRHDTTSNVLCLCVFLELKKANNGKQESTRDLDGIS